MTRDPVAVVDCGTNTTRLLISDGRGPAAERRSEITRLGRGVDATGRLDPIAVERTLECLRDYRAAIDRHHPTAVRVIATSAVRDAANRSEFLQPAETILGTAPEVLSGHQEAEMAFRGAVSELDPAEGPFLVVDIGGGSTELSFGAQHCTDALSLDIGSVRLTEKYIHHDPPGPEELSACLSVTELHLDDAVRAIPALNGNCRLVGVAGTITTVAAVELGLTTYDRDRVHHFRLSKDRPRTYSAHWPTEALAIGPQPRAAPRTGRRDRGRSVHPGEDHAVLRLRRVPGLGVGPARRSRAVAAGGLTAVATAGLPVPCQRRRRARPVTAAFGSILVDFASAEHTELLLEGRI